MQIKKQRQRTVSPVLGWFRERRTQIQSVNQWLSPIQNSSSCFPSLTLCWGDYSALLQPSLVPRETHTHTHSKTIAHTLRPKVPAVRHGGAGAHSQQLTWSSLDGALQCSGWRTCGLTASFYSDWKPQRLVLPWSLEELGPDIRGRC